VSPFKAGNRAVRIASRELSLPLGVEDIGVSRKLRSEFRRQGLRTGPISAHLVNADQLEPGCGIIWRRRARRVNRVDGFRPLLLGYVCVGEAEKGDDFIGVFGKQIVIEISRLFRATRRRVNLR